MSLPKLFGKEFLPDPNILLNNYDVFMNDPNMDTFLNGSAPKYNPNPNINLRYLYGPDYKIKDTDVSAPEPTKNIQIEITVFDKNHWRFPTDQTNTITDKAHETELTITNALKGIRTYNDMILKELHKDVINASEIDLYVSNNTFKFDATLTTEIFDSYQEPTIPDNPDSIPVERIVRDIFKLNVEVNKIIAFGSATYKPGLNLVLNGEPYGVDKLYIPNKYKDLLKSELKTIEIDPANINKSEDTMITLYQAKSEEVLEPLYKDIFYGIKIIPDSTKRKVHYKDLGEIDMLLFPKSNIKVFNDRIDPLQKLVEFHRPGAYNINFTYGETPFPNTQDSTQEIQNQTVISLKDKLLVCGGNLVSNQNTVINQQLNFDIDVTPAPGLMTLTNRLDSFDTLKVEKSSILRIGEYIFSLGGINKNSTSPNFNLNNSIQFAKIGLEDSKETLGQFKELEPTGNSDIVATKNLIETLKISVENTYFQTINNKTFAFIFNWVNVSNSGFLYIYQVEIENNSETNEPVLKFTLKTVNQHYLINPTIKKYEDLHKVYNGTEKYSKILFIDSTVEFETKIIKVGAAAETLIKANTYQSKALEFIYKPDVDDFILNPKTIIYSDENKGFVIPTVVLNTATKEEIDSMEETVEGMEGITTVTKTIKNTINIAPYLVEDNTNVKVEKKSFLLNFGLWKIESSKLWDNSESKEFKLLIDQDYTNYNIDINQKNFYKNLRRGSYQQIETESSILLINPIIGINVYSGAIQINKTFTHTEMFAKPLVEIDKNLPASQLLRAAYFSRQEEVLYQGLLVRKIQDLKAYNESIKFYDELAPNSWNEDKYITLKSITQPIVLTEDSKEFFEYLLNLCYETRLDKYNDYYYLATYSNFKKETYNMKLIIPEFFFDLIFNRQMFNINLKVLEWYWDNYIFEDEDFQAHKNNLKYKESSFTKENIKDVLVSFYKNKIKMSRPSVLNGSEDTNLYKPIIENIQKNLGQFQSEGNYPNYNLIQGNIQYPSLYQNNIDNSNLKTYEDFKYIIIPNNNGSTQGMFLTYFKSYLNHKFKGTQNLTNFASNCKIIKEYSLETLNFDEDLTFLVNFDYFIAPPENGGNDANDGMKSFKPKETCANIPDGSNVLFLPGTYTKRIKINILGSYVTYEVMLCFIGAQHLNIYGCGDSTIIRSIGSASGYRPIIAYFGSNSKDLSQLSMEPYYTRDKGVVFNKNGLTNIRNMKIIYNSGGLSERYASFIQEGINGSIFKNINFEITGNYTLQNSSNWTNTVYYQNCTFTGGNRQHDYNGKSVITSAPDNAIDTLIKNTNFNPENKVMVFDPHKQKYKPTYTLIPLASSGYYDTNENDLINLSEEEKKNINIPVLNRTRAITDLRNFKITL